jgi:hypothetical protein
MQCLIGLENVVKRNSAAFPLQSGPDFVKLSALRTIIRRKARPISKKRDERNPVFATDQHRSIGPTSQ